MSIAGKYQRYIRTFLTFILYRWFWRMRFADKANLILNALVVALMLLVAHAAREEEARRCLALNIYHEARGELIAGQIAVGHNVLNRVRSPVYPDSVCAVVYQPWQYSWTMVPKLRAVQYAQIKGSRSDIIARGVLAGKWADITNGSTHYFASRLHKEKRAPNWYKKMVPVGKIGAHEFYRDPKALIFDAQTQRAGLD